jgi:DegV family protein with EDD domain
MVISNTSEQKVVVVTDSTAYIPDAALRGLTIPVIPLWLIWDNERFRDNVDIDPQTFYQRLQGSDSFPTTSQPSVGEFIDFFRQVATETGTDTIVSVLISSEISGTVDSAQAAKAQLPELNITVIDSLSTSMGLGFIALTAARTAANNGALKDVVAATKAVRDRTNILFAVDTLEYLHRGGRIGGAKRFLGTALNIKPLLHLDEGRVEPLCQVRTKSKAISRLLDEVEARSGGRPIPEACVVDIGAPDEGKDLGQRAKERFNIPTTYRTTVSPVIGTHVGPGTVGIGFYT